jgi:hypothetical protein
VLGVADLSGELMRYAINAVGYGHRPAAFRVLETLRRLLAGTAPSPPASHPSVLGLRGDTGMSYA